MKYPKVLQVLLVASMVTTAAPGAAMPVYASAVEDGGNVGEPEERETPEEFEERTSMSFRKAIIMYWKMKSM